METTSSIAGAMEDSVNVCKAIVSSENAKHPRIVHL